MKKIVATLILLAITTISTFAEGDTPTGSKNCGTPGNPPCLVEPVETETGIIKSFTNFFFSLIG